MDRQKVRLYLLKGDEITAEAIVEMFTAITGQAPTADEVAEVRRELDKCDDARRRSKQQ